MTRLINSWTFRSEQDTVAMKALMVLPTLLLQKTSFTSKSKDNVETLKRRLNQWKDGQIEKLLVEGKIIQERLFQDGAKNQSSDRKATLFARFMEDGKVSKALKLLESSNKGGILPLTEETFEVLLEKHPKASEASNDILIQEEVQNVHPVIYDSIDSEMVRDAIKKKRGSAGPSGLDADGWRRILMSGNFGSSVEDLRKTIADMTKRLCRDNTVKHLEAFLACRLIHLDKQPGVRPIGIGEILRRVFREIVMKLLKRDVLKATGSFQLCAGQNAGSEAAIHAVYEMFNKESTEAILMVEASNAFNAINRETFLHNTKILCPSISAYVNNSYSSPTDLYSQGGRSIKLEEGTTQDDPTAMAIYALGITPLLAWLSKKSNEGKTASASKQVAFADDLNGIGTVESIKKWWSLLEEEGKKIGYNVNAKKSYLIVKEQYKDKAKEIFEDTNIKISTEGYRHLGSVIGSKQCSENYISSLITQWCEEITELSLIARTHTQAAYSAFTSGYKHKFTFFMSTIENVENFMLPLDKVIKQKLIAALFNDFQISEELRSLIALPCKLEGMGIINAVEIANEEYENSRALTKN